MPPPSPLEAPPAASDPAPPAGVHPDLCVPPSALYARYTVEDIFSQPGREGLDILDPDRLQNTYCFGAKNRVDQRVSETNKQRWHWSLAINERVKAEFVAKKKIRF